MSKRKPIKNKCGDCKWWVAGEEQQPFGLIGGCKCPLPKIAKTANREIWDSHDAECPCWRAKNVKTKASKE